MFHEMSIRRHKVTSQPFPPPSLYLCWEISIQRHKVSSHPFPPPSLYLCLNKKKHVLEISRQMQSVQPIGEISPHHPFPFYSIVGVENWLRSWLWDKVSYSQLQHRVPYTMFFFEYSLRRAKVTHKNRKKGRNFMLRSAGCFRLRAKDFSWSLASLYGGLGMSKLDFWSKNIFFCCKFF